MLCQGERWNIATKPLFITFLIEHDYLMLKQFSLLNPFVMCLWRKEYTRNGRTRETFSARLGEYLTFMIKQFLSQILQMILLYFTSIWQRNVWKVIVFCSKENKRTLLRVMNYEFSKPDFLITIGIFQSTWSTSLTRACIPCRLLHYHRIKNGWHARVWTTKLWYSPLWIVSNSIERKHFLVIWLLATRVL